MITSIYRKDLQQKCFSKFGTGISTCKCKKGFSLNRSPYQKGNMLCSLRCHKGRVCLNKNKDPNYLSHVGEFPANRGLL